MDLKHIINFRHISKSYQSKKDVLKGIDDYQLRKKLRDLVSFTRIIDYLWNNFSQKLSLDLYLKCIGSVLYVSNLLLLQN